jgi:hypothetical protein
VLYSNMPIAPRAIKPRAIKKRDWDFKYCFIQIRTETLPHPTLSHKGKDWE